jgi:hypothetical protein
MNLDRLINMIINRVMRVLISKGINKGIDAGSSALARRKSGGVQGDAQMGEVDDYGNIRQPSGQNQNGGHGQAEMTAQAQQAAKRARKMARMSKRIGRF